MSKNSIIILVAIVLSPILVVCGLFYGYMKIHSIEKGFKVDIDVNQIATESLDNQHVACFEGDYVYYSEHGIYLNDEYVQGFEDEVSVWDIALDSQFIYFAMSKGETTSLIKINRENRNEEVMIDSSFWGMTKFEDSLLVRYGEKQVATIENGELVELGSTDKKYSVNGKESIVREVSLGDYKFYYARRTLEDELGLVYIEKGEERKGVQSGLGVLVRDEKMYSFTELEDPNVIYIDSLEDTDQNLMTWDDDELYFITIEGWGWYGTIYHHYDRKIADALCKYDFNTGEISELISMKPRIGQMVAYSLENEKLYVLSGKNIKEMSFTGENEKIIGEIPIVENIYVEMCDEKLFFFTKTFEGDYKLIQTIDL